MEMSSWIANGLIPAVVAGVVCEIVSRLTRRPVGDGADHQPVGLATLVLATGWTLAVLVGLVGQRWVRGEESSFWWPEEFWQRSIWGMLAISVVMGPSVFPWIGVRREVADTNSLRWVVASMVAFAAAAIALPGGDGWDDALPLHRGWMFLLGSSGLASIWSLEHLSRSSSPTSATDRWLPLVVMAMLAGPMVVGATTYSSLATWTLSAISATAVCVVFAAWGRLPASVGIVYPAAIFCLAMISAGRFFSYESHPWWTYGGVLWVAPAVAIGDRLIATDRTVVRICVAALVAIAMIVWTVAWQFTGAAE